MWTLSTYWTRKYFNPLPPYGGRRPAGCWTIHRTSFQSTPSVWRETTGVDAPQASLAFQSTPSVWRETTLTIITSSDDSFQSTPSVWRETYDNKLSALFQAGFQSTPSVWRETDLPCHRSLHPTHFNPLPPYGGRLAAAIDILGGDTISIHSLRMEGDIFLRSCFHLPEHFNPLPPYGGRPCGDNGSPRPCDFNPLPPYGGRLCYVTNYSTADAISIHSLRMEGDKRSPISDLRFRHFNPLPPYGGRPGVL